MACGSNNAQPPFGNDSALLIPTASVEAGAGQLSVTSLPTGVNFGQRATPSRDRSVNGNSTIWFVSTYLPAPPSPAAAPITCLTPLDQDGMIDSQSNQTVPLSLGYYTFAANGAQVGCSPTSPCAIAAGDARILAVDLQTRPTDQTSYLSYAFAYPVAAGGYLDAFVMQPVANGTNSAIFYMTANDGTLMQFPTIAMDPDLNVDMTGTMFSPSQFPEVQDFQSRYYPDNNTIAVLSEGFLNNSNDSFIGQQNCGNSSGPQRWGDFNSAVWDPTLPSASGKRSTFWNVDEYTNGSGQIYSGPLAGPTPVMSSDQSSYWSQVNDPLPYQVSGSTNLKKNCVNGANCSVTSSVPTGTQAGDILVANVGIGDPLTAITLPDSTWMLLPVGNLQGAQQASSSVPCGAKATAWIATHVYQSGDPAQFSFSHNVTYYDACGIRITPFIGAWLTSYRDAGHLFSNYGLSGFGSTINSKTFTFGPMSVPSPSNSAPAEGTMMVQLDLTGSGGTAITAFTGSPILTSEASSLSYDAPYYIGQTSFGAYTATQNCSPATQSCDFINWALAIPSY